MAIITLPYRYLERLTGTDRKTIIERIPMIGADIERIGSTGHWFSRTGPTSTHPRRRRAMRGFLGIEEGLPVYNVARRYAFSVGPGLPSGRALALR